MLAFDAFATGSALPGNSITFSHTCTGSNLILIVGISSNNADVITGVTYNGVALTLGKKSTTTAPTTYFFYLINPATGAHNVVVSASGAGENLRAISVSYTGAQQSGQPDATAEQRTSGTSVTTSLTQVGQTAWQIGLVSNAASGTVSAGTGVGALRANVGNVTYIGDSNTTTTAGTQSLIFTNSTSTQLDALQFSLLDVEQATVGTLDQGYSFFL